MDTEKFELTEEEQMKALDTLYLRLYGEKTKRIEVNSERDIILLKAQVAKVLSLLEPVELEALGEEEDEEVIPPAGFDNYGSIG